jgi:23S rRNA (guanine745-N1)-methyltransferase
LLPVNKKKSKSPGDNDMMVKARREFLEEGFYDPLMQEIKNVIDTELAFDSKEINILDSGCGEGYYSENALSNLENINSNIIGTDISKHAVKQAAGKHKENFYFVSSIYNLPVKTDSIDLILSVFSPNDPKEFGRVLNQNGYLIIVSPGENHMKQLAELIYDSFRPHEYNIIEKIGESFSHNSTHKKTFDIEINDSDMLQNLLKMTPYYWNTSKEGQEKIENCNSISITCDFNITVFKQK